MENGKIVLVGSLPRTGSAWLSVLLNLHPDCLCLHEGAYKYPDHFDFLKASGYTYIADIGSHCMFPVYDSIKAKRVFLKRDTDDVIASAKRFLGFDGDTIDTAVGALNVLAFSWIRKHNPYIVSYEELFKEETIVKLWAYIFDGEKPDMDKLSQIIKLNIQAQPPSKEFKTLIGLT